MGRIPLVDPYAPGALAVTSKRHILGEATCFSNYTGEELDSLLEIIGDDCGEAALDASMVSEVEIAYEKAEEEAWESKTYALNR